MSFLTALHVVSLLVYVHLGLFALVRNPKSWTNRSFAAFCFCFALWSFGDIFTHSPSASLQLAKSVGDVTAIAWTSFASLYLCFILFFTRNEKLLKSRPFVAALVSLPVLCFLANWSGSLKVYGVRKPWGWPYLWADSTWRFVFYAYCLSFVSAGIFLVYDFIHKASRPIERKQANTIYVGTVITLALGTITDGVLPELRITSFPRVGSVIVLLLAVAIVVAITKYRFLTITPATASESILSTMSDSLILLDPQANIVTANKAALNLLGYTKEELEGRSIGLFTAELGLRDSLLDGATRGEPPGGPAPHLRTKSGEMIPVSFSSSVLRDESGDCAGIVCIARDITERKRAEEALQKAHHELGIRVEERNQELSVAIAELARASRLKDEFLASMSHELRTPLNAILGMSESLQEEIHGSLTGKQCEAVETVARSGRRLLDLINDILDLAKIGAGEMTLDIEPVPINHVCEAALASVKQAALQKQIDVSCALDQTATTVHVDSRRVTQILANLLSNAVKFTPEGGKIGLEVRGNAGASCIDFTVWDTGVGIPSHDLGRLFEPFVQLDGKLSRRYAGTGLGLSLVRKLSELHGGKASVESQVGRGSRFTVSLPWPESPEADTEVAERERGEDAFPASTSP